MASIKLNHVHKKYNNGFLAVKDFHLDIEQGEFIVLLGPSGCGKTTTMRMIAGLEDITEGDLLFDDNRMNDLSPRDRDISMVFQNYGLYPHMSVRENIRYPLKIRGLPKADHDALIMKAAERVELTDLLDRKPKQLSGGQRQRVALARSLVREPSVFLMDEPLSNLDAKLRVIMRAELKHLHHELGITTVYVTHDQLEAMTLADRVVIMNQGEVMQVGTPEEIYNEPSNVFVAGFIGSPAMNLVEGEVKNGAFIADGVNIPNVMPANKSIKNVILGARCEDMKISDDKNSHLNASLYSLELLGESTQLTLSLPNKKRIVVKCAKDVRKELDTSIGANFNTDLVYLFDAESGDRLA